MTATASKLDTEKFAKVHRLMKDGATEGERAAARARAEAMAQRAGMTLKQATSKVCSKPKTTQASGHAYSQKPAGPSFSDIFRDIDDRMEEKYPGYKARQQAKKDARAAAKAQRRDRLLREFGSMAGVFARSPIEQALFSAATPFAKREKLEEWCGTPKWFTTDLAGASEYWFLKDAPPAAVEMIRKAWPMPDSFVGLMAEARSWYDLRDDRQAFVNGEYNHDREVYARLELIEQELKTRPVSSWEDMQIRFDWERFRSGKEFLDPEDGKEEELVVRLREDFAILRRLYENPAQNGQGEGITTNVTLRRTNADKQRDVKSMLDASPELSDREIARRCGVSAQTVGNWRRRRAA